MSAARRPVASADRAHRAPGSAGVDAVSVLLDVAFIAEHWDELLKLREPGTPRPWRQALLDPDQRAELLERDHIERQVRDPDAPGFTSAPQHLDVLDVIVGTWATLDELAGLLAKFTDGVVLASSRRTPIEIGDQVAMIAQCLPSTVGTLEQLPAFTRVVRQLTALVDEVNRALGLVRAGQLLVGAVCPWCRGVTPKHPAGGHPTMRVEEIAKAKHATDLRPAVEAVHAVVCWNTSCDPDEADCGVRWRGRPAWPWHEWDWLAKRLILADRGDRLPPPESPRPAGFSDEPVQPIDHSSRSGYATPRQHRDLT